MRPTLQVHAVKVAGYPRYVCSTCGMSALGGWYSVDIGGGIPTHDEVDRLIGPHYMPVGWATYGGSEYKCKEHAT